MNAFPFQRCIRYTCIHLYIFRLDHAFQSLQVRWKSCICIHCHSITNKPAEYGAVRSPLYCSVPPHVEMHLSLQKLDVSIEIHTWQFILAEDLPYRVYYPSLVPLASLSLFFIVSCSAYFFLSSQWKCQIQNPTYALDLSSTVPLVTAHQALECSASKCELVITLNREEHNTNQRLFLH